jgi:hypothetical protein
MGGFKSCPKKVQRLIVLWMVKCYIGRKNKQTGRLNCIYKVAPKIEEIFTKYASRIARDVEQTKDDADVKSITGADEVRQRLNEIRNLVSRCSRRSYAAASDTGKSLSVRAHGR